MRRKKVYNKINSKDDLSMIGKIFANKHSKNVFRIVAVEHPDQFNTIYVLDDGDRWGEEFFFDHFENVTIEDVIKGI